MSFCFEQKKRKKKVQQRNGGICKWISDEIFPAKGGFKASVHVKQLYTLFLETIGPLLLILFLEGGGKKKGGFV